MLALVVIEPVQVPVVMFPLIVLDHAPSPIVKDVS